MAWPELSFLSVINGIVLAILVADRFSDRHASPAHAPGRCDERQASVGTAQSTEIRGPLGLRNEDGQHIVLPGHLLYDDAYHRFAVVTDLDLASRHPEKFLWTSILRKGALVRNPRTGNFSVQWGEQVALTTKTSRQNRSMELSELVRFKHLYLAMCDYTGLVFKVMPEDGTVFQRYAVADGNGDFSKPFKAEWATVKDGLLWVGSTGIEWSDPNGTILHYNPQWVKTIDRNGRINNYNWRTIYGALRQATNTSYPGYLWHEAVHFDQRSRRWIFLPRKASHCAPAFRSSEPYADCVPYSPKADETMGTNLIVIASEDFADIMVRRIGPLQPTYGFTSVRKVPGTADVYVALKVKELGGTTETLLTVFDLEGRFLLDVEPESAVGAGTSRDGAWVAVGYDKFEGLEFLTMSTEEVLA